MRGLAEGGTRLGRIRQPTCGGAMGVLNVSNRLNFPFFMRLARPWVRAFRRAGRAGPAWGPLSTYPLADSGRFIVVSALIALPFGRFSASSLLGTLIHVTFGRFGA